MKKLLAIILLVILLISVICCVACTKETELDKIVKCVNQLKDQMAYPENFEIDGDCGYRRGYDDYPLTVFIYIPFKVCNEDGEYWYDIAYFANGSFVGYDSDYEDGTYEEWDIDDKLLFLSAALIYLGDVESTLYSKEEVDKAISPKVEEQAIA